MRRFRIACAAFVIGEGAGDWREAAPNSARLQRADLGLAAQTTHTASTVIVPPKLPLPHTPSLSLFTLAAGAATCKAARGELGAQARGAAPVSVCLSVARAGRIFHAIEDVGSRTPESRIPLS